MAKLCQNFVILTFQNTQLRNLKLIVSDLKSAIRLLMFFFERHVFKILLMTFLANEWGCQILDSSVAVLLPEGHLVLLTKIPAG